MRTAYLLAVIREHLLTGMCNILLEITFIFFLLHMILRANHTLI